MIKKVFPILALAMFASMLGVGLISPLLPLYSESLGATGLWIGIIFAGYSASRAIVMPFAGRLSDRFGKKLFLCIGLIGYAIISPGYVLANSALQLTFVRLIQGAAGGMIIPIAMAYVGDLSPEGEEGKWMGYANAAFFGGFSIGPLMGGLLNDSWGMDSAFYIMGVLNLLAFIIGVIFLPEIKQEKTVSTPHTSIRSMSRSSIVKGLFSFRLVDALGRGGFSTFLPIFGGTYLGLSPSLIGVILATNVILMTALQTYFGRFADRFNRKALLVIGSLISLVLLALIPFGHNFWQLLLLCGFMGIGRAISIPAASALTVEEGRKFGMGSTMGAFMMAMSIGMALGPIACGLIADIIDINSVFYFAGGMGLLGTIMFIWFTR
ncbi:MAG: MFS transporter [Dehalococcoidales bacterium]|nr:MFS transporter [Dehalococcoidales bacterium]